jgi:hypothetical protein
MSNPSADRRIHGGLGMAEMAMRLATHRCYPYSPGWSGWNPLSRGSAERMIGSASAEYYRIIDRIANGEHP